MKKIFAILSLLGISILSGCGSSSLSVQEYNDALVGYTDDCIMPTQDLWENFNIEEIDAENLLKSLDDCIKICIASRNNVSKLGKYDGDDSLRDAVETILDIYIEYLMTFAQSSKYRTLQEMPEEEKSEYESISSKISALLQSLETQTQNLKDIQESFAEKYGLKLGA